MSVKTYTDSTTRIITKTIEEHVWESAATPSAATTASNSGKTRTPETSQQTATTPAPIWTTNGSTSTTPTPPSKPHSNTAGKKATKASNEATSTAPHTTKTNKTPTTKKETTPALAGIGKGEPMTALLVGRLRELATQTHLLETKVSSLGWMAGAGTQTLKSMTRAQAHLMLAECDLLDALEANEKKEKNNE